MSDYTDDISTDDISTMEELDPEPQPKGRGHAREFVLGALLLLAVIGWAGWQSWQQDAKQRAYHQAEQEVASQRWESAHHFFTSASGYRDADARAEQIETLIKERDEHYHAANLAMWSKNWVEQLKELQAVRGIQANFQDVETLYATAEAEAYRQALQGAIALRSGAEPPGLYYHTGTGWVWLEGSDRWSQVLGATYGSVAYDVPGPGWQAGATPTPVPFNRQPPSGRPELQGRKLKLATIEGTAITVRDSSLDPAFYSLYFPVGDRLIAGRYNERPGTYIQAVRSGYTGWWLDYERAEQGRPVSTTISMGAPEETILDFSPANERYVAAVSGGISIRSSKIEVSLGVKGEDGGYTRRPLYSHVGQLGGAQVSPDGRYMLLTTISPVDRGVLEEQSALLFDLVAETPPITLTTRTVPVETIGSFVSFDTWVKSTFLREGDYAGKLLIVDRDGQQLTLSLIDPANPGARTVVAQIAGNNYLFYIKEKPGGSELWLSGWSLVGDPTPENFGRNSRLLFVTLTPGSEARINHMPQVATGYVRTFGVYGERLVYEQRTNSNVESHLEVYSVPNSILDGEQEIVPRPVYTSPVSVTLEGRGLGYSAQNPSWYPGEGLFAYAVGGSLYVREYDGSHDVKLEGNVLHLIDMRTYLNITYFR